MNIGAKTEQAFQSADKSSRFRDKLSADIGTLLGMGCHLLSLQEVSHLWAGEVRKLLPPGWSTCFGGHNCLLAYCTKHWKFENAVEDRCFPSPLDRDNPYRRWRTFLRVPSRKHS